MPQPNRSATRQAKPQPQQQTPKPFQRPAPVVSTRAPEPQPSRDDIEEEVPLTKLGHPDRRYKGFREMPAPQETNPEYRRASTGPVLEDGTHLTLTGKPDRRFKENRGKTDEEIMLEWAQAVQAQFNPRK